jgi:hypothetical protein
MSDGNTFAIESLIVLYTAPIAVIYSTGFGFEDSSWPTTAKYARFEL